eukprot:7482598-Pyramimonas_sp.AAC.1
MPSLLPKFVHIAIGVPGGGRASHSLSGPSYAMGKRSLERGTAVQSPQRRRRHRQGPIHRAANHEGGPGQ